MRITIQNNELVYIYLQKGETLGDIETIPYVDCQLYVDSNNEWIGIKILNRFIDDYKKFELPKANFELECFDVELQQDRNFIKILFDNKSEVNKKFNQECNIDIREGNLYGIEIILYKENQNMKRNIIKKFIEYDN